MAFFDHVRAWFNGPPPAEPESPEEEPPAPTVRASSTSVDEAQKRDDKRAKRRLREAEERAADAEARAVRAEERARVAEKAQAAMQAGADSAATRIALANDRARLAELALKSEADAHKKTRAKKSVAPDGDRAKDSGSAKQADDRLRAARGRAEQAERERDEALERARTLEKRCLELAASVDSHRERAEAAEARLPENDAPAQGTALESTLRSIAEAHFSPGEACLDVIRDQLARARTSADVCVFTITDDRIAQSLLRAHDRGIRVRVITDDDKALDEGSDIDRLARAGIAVRKDRSEYHMHHKFAVFDGRRLLTGSYNWTRGAARYNEENLVLVSDPRLVGAFDREFEDLWGRFAP